MKPPKTNKPKQKSTPTKEEKGTHHTTHPKSFAAYTYTSLQQAAPVFVHHQHQLHTLNKSTHFLITLLLLSLRKRQTRNTDLQIYHQKERKCINHSITQTYNRTYICSFCF